MPGARIRLKLHENPWIVQPQDNRRPSDSPLCDRCRRFDMKAMFDRPFSDYVYFDEGATRGIEPLPLIFGTVREIKQQTGCPLCCLVWKSFLLYNDGLEPPEQANGRQVSIDVESVACGLYGNIFTYEEESDEKNKSEPEAFAIRLHFTLEPWIRRPFDYKRSARPEWQAVIHRIDDTQAILNKLCSGRQIGDQGPEGSLMRKWLRLCQEQHVLCTNDEFDFEYPNRLIDIRRECLVEKSDIPSRPHYAILSYVWGTAPFITLNSSTSDLLHNPGIISINNDEIPASIRDTIQLCRSLNQEYLWVDALCIKQDGLQDKLTEISRMDDIYGGAALTIVAVSGDRASAGLPGMGHTPRVNTQHLLEIDGLVLSNRIPGAPKLIEESIWNSRAWTYQERLLSRRLLSFTDRQVFFTCRQMQCCEDTVTERTVPHTESPLRAAGLSDDDDDGYLEVPTAISPLEYPYDNMTEFQKYAHLVMEYSKRSMSFESDILNAFQGVMGQLSFRVFKSETEYNLPLRLIDIAILWRPLGPLRKRDLASSKTVIPSWAWAWWVGPIEYAEQPNLAERTLSQRIQQFEKAPCKMPPSRPAHWIKKTNTSRDAGTSGGYRRQIVEGEIWYFTNVRYTTKFDTSGLLCRPANDYHQQDPDLDPFNGILTLRTSVAELFVTKQHVAEDDHYFSSPPCIADNHQVCHLLITNIQGVRAGCVVVDGNTAGSLEPGMFSFVKLSRTTITHGDDDSAWDPETEAFVGVPGEPAINPDFEESRQKVWFDSDVFDSSICWCLYNIMMVKWREDGVGLRLGIGKMHVHAFDAAAGDEKNVNLG
jgi:hypothetical protein